MSHTAVARQLNCHHSTILRLGDRINIIGTHADRPKSAQTRETSPRHDAVTRMLHRRNRLEMQQLLSGQLEDVYGLNSCKTDLLRLLL